MFEINSTIPKNTIFLISSAMNYKSNPGFDLEFQPFLAVWPKKTFTMFFLEKTAVKNSIFVQLSKVRYQNVWNKFYYPKKIQKCL